jgi:hypothetical protein
VTLDNPRKVVGRFAIAPGVWVLLALSLLAAAGLVLPGLAGEVGSYVWLGVFPGLAVARMLLPRSKPLTLGTLGLVFSPLISAVAGLALARGGLDLATAARLVGIGGWILYAGGEARAIGRPADDPREAPVSRFAWIWALGAAAFVVACLALNPWSLIRSDTWVHAAIIGEIRLHGVPPIDPRFIGLHLNYVWFFQFFIAQLASLRGQDSFVFMALVNVVTTAVQFLLVWQLAWALWGSERAARGTMVLFTLGLNAGAYLLTPLRFLLALSGEVRGMDEIHRQLALLSPGSWDVIYILAAPFAWMVQFWDKITLGGPLGYAYLFLLLHFLALARVLRGGGGRWLAVAFLAGLGSALPHSVVGMGMIPVTTGAVALGLMLRARAPWLPDARAALPFWGASGAGFALGLPYLISIARGWRNDVSGLGHHWIEPGWRMPWTLATACGVTLLFAWPGIRRAWRERVAFAAWLSLWALGVVLMQCIAHLPEGNEHKYVWVAFLVLALLGGGEFMPAMERWRARLGAPLFAIVIAIVFVVPPLAFLQGVVRDPMRTESPALNPRPGEGAMLEWIRSQTMPDDVFLETANRDLLTVQGPRRMLVATRAGADRCAFPVSDFERRREVTADLFGPVAEFDADAAYLAEVVRKARRLHGVGSVHLLFRAEDFAAGDAPWLRLEAAAGTRVAKRYDADGYRIYALDLPEAR